MYDEQIESWINEFIVNEHVFKALQVDRRWVEYMKLSRPWNEFFEYLTNTCWHEWVNIKHRLKNSGCKIVLQEITEKKEVHVVYVHKGYEHHCTVMAQVLKGKCEEKLQSIVHRRPK